VFRDGAPPDTPAAATAAMRMLLRCDGGAAGDVWLSTPGVQDMAALRCPAFFIADVDCKRGDALEEDIVAAYLAALGLAPGDVGRLVQISSATRRGKVSMHIKVNVFLPYWSAGRAVAAFVTAALRAAGAPADFAPDPAIYGARNQLIRALWSCKRLASGPPDLASELRPHGRSSASPADHSGRMHRHNPQPLATMPPALRAVLVQELAAVAGAPGRALNAGSQTRPDQPSRKRPADCSDTDIIRAALADSGMAAALGPLFDPEDAILQQCVASDDCASLTCNVDGTLSRGGATLSCPFSGRPHTTNRARIEVRLLAGFVAYTCYSAPCRAHAPLLMRLPRPQASRDPNKAPSSSRAD
jgi:hypothetical protein